MIYSLNLITILSYLQPFIFNEVVSLDTWDKVLSQEDRDRLSQLLPTFDDNKAKEERDTIK